MTFAVELQVRASPAVRAVLLSAHLCGVTGAVVLASSLYSADRPWAGAALAAAAFIAAVLSWRRGIARLAAGRLTVGADGAARWQPAPVPMTNPQPGRPARTECARPDRSPSPEPARPGADRGVGGASAAPAAPNVLGFQALRWHSIGPLAWVDGTAGGFRVRLLIGRDAVSATQWRRLHAWLRWMDRGGASRHHLESAGATPISP